MIWMRYSTGHTKCKLRTSSGERNCQNIPRNLGKDLKFRIFDLILGLIRLGCNFEFLMVDLYVSLYPVVFYLSDRRTP